MTASAGVAAPTTLAAARSRVGSDHNWLWPMLTITAVELLWWAIAWKAGIAPFPRIVTYFALTSLGLGAAVGVRLAMGLEPADAEWRNVVLGAALVGLAASIFLPLKYAIPHEVAFWLDRPLAVAERSMFGADPWFRSDRTLGWATKPFDWVYGTWLPVQTLALFLLILSRPSPAKSRALVAYSLTWFMLGVLAAACCSSAGPIFYDRLFGGTSSRRCGQLCRSAAHGLRSPNRTRCGLRSQAIVPGWSRGSQPSRRSMSRSARGCI